MLAMHTCLTVQACITSSTGAGVAIDGVRTLATVQAGCTHALIHVHLAVGTHPARLALTGVGVNTGHTCGSIYTWLLQAEVLCWKKVCIIKLM